MLSFFTGAFAAIAIELGAVALVVRWLWSRV